MMRTSRVRVLQVARTTIGIALFAVFLLEVAVWTVYGFVPRAVVGAPTVLVDLGAPDRFWPILVAFAAATGAAWALSAGIRDGGGEGGEVRLSPIAAGVLGPSALLLAFAAYWPCSGDESPVWAGLRHSLELFEGVVYEPFGQVEGCPAVIPQGLQAASLFASVTVALTVGIAVAKLFQRSVHRVRAVLAPQVVIFSGLSEETMDAARAVRRNLTRRQRLLLFEAGDEIERARALAHEIGALVLSIDVTDAADVGRFLRQRGRRGLQGLYLLSADSAANLQAMHVVIEGVSGLGPEVRRTEVPGRVVVRVDNPWHAEDWRRNQMIGRPGWLFDAVSVYEIAARQVLAESMGPELSVDTIVIPGSSAFDLALLSELSFEHRLSHLLGRVSERGRREWEAAGRTEDYEPYVGTPPSALLVGPGAAETARHFLTQLERYGVENFDEVVRVAPDLRVEDAMKQLEGAGRRPALVVHRSSERDPTFLAVQHPRWTIFDWEPNVHGVTRESLLGGLHLAGPTLTPVQGIGLDIWDRLGTVQHLIYLLNFQGGAGVAQLRRYARRQAVTELDLDPFLRESNVRSVARFLQSVGGLSRPRKLGTDLGPNGAEQDASVSDPGELLQLAEQEHRSWVAHHREYGYRYGKERRGKRHPDMVAWEELSEHDRLKDVENVKGAQEMLRALGFVLTARSGVDDVSPEINGSSAPGALSRSR